MSDHYLVRCNGGPYAGDRVFDATTIPWPPPDVLACTGGEYRKVSQSPLSENTSHVVRGAQYRWHSDDDPTGWR